MSLPDLLRRLGQYAHYRDKRMVGELLGMLGQHSKWTADVDAAIAAMPAASRDFIAAYIVESTTPEVGGFADQLVTRGGPAGPEDPLAGVVTKDATSGIYAPANATEWAAVIAVAGLSTGPTHTWVHSEAASPLDDKIGTDDMSEAVGGVLYQQAKTGWSRVGIVFADAGGGTVLTAATYNSSTLFLAYVGLNGTPAASRSIAYGQGEIGVETTRILSGDTTTGAADVGTTVRPLVIKVDRTGSTERIYSDQEIIAQTYGAATNVVGFGSVVQSAAPMWIGYSALFTGAAAELTDAQLRTLLQTLKWSPAW